jgi:universal stress protein A
MSQKSRFAAATLPKEAWTSRLVVRNILCPVDFSEFSSRAVRYASEIARHFNARVVVQHTVSPPTVPIPEGLEVISPEEMLQASRDTAAKRLGRLLAESGTGDAEFAVRVNSGDVKDRIVQTVAEDNIDLVVMGTHGHKGLTRLVRGSVAEHIIHEVVFCPVLVVSRPQVGFLGRYAPEPMSWKTILAPVDFSEDSGRSLTHALRWAAEWKAKVILFHAVQDPPPRMHGISTCFPSSIPTSTRKSPRPGSGFTQ